MSYKRKFSNPHGTLSPISGTNSNSNSWNAGMNNTQTGGWSNEFAFRNYQSRLPEVYTGHPNRIERYNQYEMMDVDPEINACLDILAEFSTQENEQNRTPFEIIFHEDPTSTEVDVIKKQLQQWVKLNEFDSRIFKIFRNAVKYGDQVFVRDPENFKLYWVDMTKVVKVIVNESEGKKPEQYVIKDINPNLQNLSVAEKTTTDFQAQPPTAGYSAPYSYTVPNEPYGTTGSRFSLGINENAIDARHIVHLSITEGLDRYWPFGQSILENIFKVYKQKELLEDAVLIYRVSRAPERRVFKIDVGNMPSHMAMQFVNRIKDEIHQRRIPSVHGGQSTVDATYNPLSTNEDYFFPVTAEGRGSSVEMLQGGCFSMDTRVSLLDGRELSIADIEKEIGNGKTLWTYSCEPLTGRVVPGLITWAGVTKKSARVMKITLSNGEQIICTPEHKFPVYEQEFKRADEFTVGDSMIPLYRRKESISDSKNDCEQYFDNYTREWNYTHRMIADYSKEAIIEYSDKNHDSQQIEYNSWNKDSIHNHTVVAIEWLDDEIPVGTLTIDGDEIHHDYHTFALSCGVFVFNSNLGEIDDLKYFNNRLARGLRIPSSYLPTGPEESERPLVDGKVGTALIQEFRFNKYCERLQGYIARKLNEEFKLFLKWRGFNIDNGLFDLKFNPPQNFAAYRQSEIDQVRVNVFNSIAPLPYISTRFALERFLGLTQEEIKQNEKQWREERSEPEKDEPKGKDLRGIGLSTSDIESDLETAEAISEPETPETSMAPEITAPVTPGGPETGAVPPPA